MSGGGLASRVAEQMGMGGMLTMRNPFHRSWSYDRRTQILTIETSARVVLGRQQNDTITIRVTGREQGAISGQDLAGRHWTLRPVGESTRSRAIEAKRQEVRQGFRKILDSAKDSPALAGILASYCLCCADESEYDLGLPTEQARSLARAKGDAARDAFKDFVRALEQGGGSAEALGLPARPGGRISLAVRGRLGDNGPQKAAGGWGTLSGKERCW